MIVYFSMFFLVIVFGLSAQYFSSVKLQKEKVFSNGSVSVKNQYGVFYILLIIVFLYVGGFRYYVGTDFGGYYKYYHTWEEIVDQFKNLDEPGFWFIDYICRSIWDEGVFVIFTVNMIVVLLTFYGISKYDENEITIYLFLFIFIGAWMFSFNGVRQALACAIIFVGISTIERQFNSYPKLIIKIIIVCFIGYLFHKSSILIAPIMLLSHRKIDSKQVLILAASAIAIPLLFDSAFEVMEVNTESETSMAYINSEINPIRVIVSAAPIILLALIKDKDELYTNERFICNLTFFHAILTITTMRSAYMHRITQYTSYFVIVFIVRCFHRINVKIRWIVIAVTMILYFAYWLYGTTTSPTLSDFNWSFSHIGEY